MILVLANPDSTICITYLSINQLKIDKSIVQNINTNQSDQVIIQAILGMAKGLNLEVIAEGIEDQVQLDYFESQNCFKFQGYLFSEPVLPGPIGKNH
ncbi:MAG: EAL domain-containing protein [Tatlockia sp.]|nr:EAL domain-containing protein [Tatlockia sp.]